MSLWQIVLFDANPNLPAKEGDEGLIPRKILWRRKWQPIPVFFFFFFGIHQSFIIMLLDSLGQEFDQYIVGVSCLHGVFFLFLYCSGFCHTLK